MAAQALDAFQGIQRTVSDSVSTMFRKSLSDLVRGIRANKDDEAKYISVALQEIKEELQSQDVDIKATAIQKLTYLQMFGHDMNWAAFRMIEVIAQSNEKFSRKRVGYLAASQSFNERTDVMVLATNLIRKDCLSHQMYDAGVAINCLANICTTELARDLVPDIVSMVTSARPYTRKKAVLVLYKIFLKFPEALRPTFPRLRDKLEDQDPSVVSAAVNVICELSRKNAKNYLPLAPTLFKLLTTSNNNWMLIKIVKLFAVLCPLEERLAKKLAEPLTNIIANTTAMSLLYEAIQACIQGLHQFPNVMKLCIGKLRTFVEHPDPNLKYLGLTALSRIMTVFPRGIMEHRDIILGCLEDEDTTIRSRALDLVAGMVDMKNISFIITKLKGFMDQADGAYRSELMERIVNICSQEKYKFVGDFEWYIDLLMDLSQVKNCSTYHLLRDQLMDVAVRVKVVREYAVRSMLILLHDQVLYCENVDGGMYQPLYAAAWIVGEFAELCLELPVALDLLTRPVVLGLPPFVQSIFVQAAMKVYIAMADDSASFAEATQRLTERLTSFTLSSDLEVQERACFLNGIVSLAQSDETSPEDIKELMEELKTVVHDPLNPVSGQAQSRVKPPEGLDLDKWIHEPLVVEVPVTEEQSIIDQGGWGGIPTSGYGSSFSSYGSSSSQSGFGGNYDGYGDKFVPSRQLDEEEIRRRAAARRAQQARLGSPYILQDTDEAPVRTLNADDLNMSAAELRGALGGATRASRGAPRGAARGGRGGPARRPPMKHESVQLVEEENPEGWVANEEDQAAKKPGDALSRVSLLDDENEGEDILQHQQHRLTQPGSSTPTRDGPSTRGGLAARGQTRGRVLRGRGRGRGRGGASSSAPASSSVSRAPVRLAADSHLTVSARLIASRQFSGHLNTEIILTNMSTEPIFPLALDIASGANVYVVIDGSKVAHHSVEMKGTRIEPKSDFKIELQIGFETVTARDQLELSLKYNPVEEAEGASELTGILIVPISTFILPPTRMIDSATLMQLLRTSITETQVASLNMSLPAAIRYLINHFGVKVVAHDPTKASLYGETLQQHPVAFLVKIDSGALAVAIKSNNGALASGLLLELEAAETRS